MFQTDVSPDAVFIADLLHVVALLKKKKKKRFWLVSLANRVAVPWGLRFGTLTRTLSKCLMRFNVRTRRRVTKPKFGVKNKSPRYLDS